MIIKKASVGQESVLTDIANASKAHWGYSREFMLSCRDELLVSREDLSNFDMLFSVLENSDRPIGFYQLNRIRESRIQLEALFVAPSDIGLGHGKLLFSHARNAASDYGGLFLDVQSDPNALGFYQSCGMQMTGKLESESIKGRFLPTLTIKL
jgi:GNAT superfamily N-acetyltransferase